MSGLEFVSTGASGSPGSDGPDLRLEADGGIVHVITGFGAGIDEASSHGFVYELDGRLWFSCALFLAGDATTDQLTDLWQNNVPLFYLPDFKARFPANDIAAVVPNAGAAGFVPIYATTNGYYWVNGRDAPADFFAAGASLLINCSLWAVLPT